MSYSYQQAAEAVRARLSRPAVAHSERVASTAGGLALVYGVDPELAKLAGLLHDWDREQSDDSLLASAARLGIDSTSADEAVPYLLHARTGASGLAVALPGLPEEVTRAVSRHTLGAADMCDLDMVVYLADMIEPDRVYPGVEELRQAVGTVSLHELFALGYQQSVAYLVSARRRIHPETIAVWNALVAGGSQ